MPLTSINLFALREGSTLPYLLKHIKSSTVKPLIISKPIRWIILPEKIETKQLLDPQWHLLLILLQDQSSKDLLSSINDPQNKRNQWQIAAHYQVVGGVPSRLTNNFTQVNHDSFLHPPPSSVPKLTGALNKPLVQSSSQSLMLSPELQKWIESFSTTNAGKSAVSMLNLLAFKPDLKSSYLQYGKAFAETIGAKRGGNAKLVGNLVHDQDAAQDTVRWDEFALAHYPSILHFADMLASEDYQAVNQKHRVPALRDTCILCTSEIEIEEYTRKEKATGSPKL